MGGALGQEAPEPTATGLRLPTAAEKAWMDQHMKKTKRVRLNKLGLERVNQWRKGRGLEPLLMVAAPEGEEVLGPEATDADDAGSGGGGAPALGEVLPAALDNSALASFPPVRSQGSIGSCASFSTTYYMATYMLGQARGFLNKNDADNSTKLSPKWTYPMVNGGQDSGSWFAPTFDVLIRHGAATWADWPYSGQNTPSSYREWCRDGSVWRRAAHYRMAEAGTLNNMHTAAGLNDLKTLLANGYVLVFATDVNGWRYTTIPDDPSTAEDQPFVSKRICYFVAGQASGHAMTVVGYNDTLWCDVNKNGRVDSGEKGALRICNSWGAGWLPGSVGPGDGGFTWLAYDALRPSSAVAGANTPDRAPGSLEAERTAWWYNQAYWLTARPAYTPKLLAQFTLLHATRDELKVQLGRSPTSSTVPAAYWTPGALQSQGGSFAFDGAFNAVPGTFVLDLSDLTQNGSGRYYLALTDVAFGSPANVSEFKLIDAAGNILATAFSGIPGQADASTTMASLIYTFSPPAILNGGSTNVQVGVPFVFVIQASGNATSFGANGLPHGLTVNSTTGRISGTPTQSGTFVVSLSASNPSGTGSGTLSITVGSTVVSPPAITSATTGSGTVGVPFSYTITASGSPTSFGADGLPPGVGINATTGIISGTPTQPGSFAVQLTAQNAGGAGSRNLTLTIQPPPAATPVINSPLTAQAQVGSPFTYRITALNNPTSFAADGLPSELSVNPVSGLIAGTLSLARDHTITLRANNPAGVGFATLLLSVEGDSSFGPANDAFANRTVLRGAVVAALGGNNNATAESGEPAHAGNPASRSVWWTWTAPGDGVATLSTVDSDFDTVLAAYTGTAVHLLTLVGEDDESGGNRTSLVSFPTTAGTAYALCVDGYRGAAGNIRLSVNWTGTTPLPPNDAFVNSVALTGATVATNGQNFGASAEAGEPSHAGFAASKSVWWSWTAPGAGTVRVSTAGSDLDTLLAVYTGATVNALSLVAGDDESGGNNTSALTFNAAAGVTYRVAVDGYQGATGTIVLGLVFTGGSGAPANDAFANRTPLSGTSFTAGGVNANATGQPGEPAHAGQPPIASVWWSWTAPASGSVTVDTFGSTFDTVLAVYLGASVSALSPLVSNDDTDGLLISRVSFAAVAGTTYQVAVDGFEGAQGDIVLHWQTVSTAPANDNMANAAVLSGLRPSATGVNINATAQAGEPSHAGSAAHRSVWWVWTAPGRGRMTFGTAGSSFDTILAIYTGPVGGPLQPVVSADDSYNDSTSTASFWADAGTTYRIAVDGFQGASGNILLGGELEAAGDRLYATDFESFASGIDRFAGTDGWLGENLAAGVQGIANAFAGQGRGAYLGYNLPTVSPVLVYRPVNFQPVAQERPVVTLSTQLAVMDSDNGAYDAFAFSFYNQAGQFLAGILFDNANLQISYDNRSGVLVSTGAKFQNHTPYLFVVTMDFGANTWWATLNGAILFTNRTFHAGGLSRDLQAFSAEWYVGNFSQPGNNYLLFDNLTLSASAGPSPPVITAQPQSRTNTVGSVANFSVAASSAGPLSYQWQFNSVDLPGATGATLTLLNLVPTHAGAYRVRVSNSAGSVLSQPATLTVQQQNVPLRLSRPQLATRGFGVRLDGGPGRAYLLEYSTNLSTWAPVSGVTMDAQGTAFYFDLTATNRIRAYYRLRTPD